ncbi:MBL fold metallo-hydrolase [Massilia sp. METH4]|uniref:ComEC/Rec2 family competence protein n=1 Tax=Massilia sp. METH4 TaxID=3123041 RepID=UPI0030CE86DB
MPERRYAAYPTATLYEFGKEPDKQPPAEPNPLKQLLWGDELDVLGASADGRYLLVFARKARGWMRVEDTVPDRLLEVVFVDIGQGDGALVITPEGKRYVVDAGKGDNMARFLRWRFGFKQPTTFDAAVVSHSDLDHYGGFEDLFKQRNLRFARIYTNGLMERAAEKPSQALGVPVEWQGKKYITDLVTNLEQFQAFLAAPERAEGKRYPTMLREAFEDGKFDDLRMLDASATYMPGHEPGEPLLIKVLGPVADMADGRKALRWFGDVGKTKNGHSVALHLKYRNVRIFLGGDLNIESSRHLLGAHTGLPGKPANAAEENALVEAARPWFESDIAKACHHGSADTLLPLIRSINPIATIISSGDDEPYAHPRADALGAIARWSRGIRPLLLSTELARSSKETIKWPEALRAQLRDLAAKIAQADTDEERDRAQAKFEDKIAELDRSVAVYGAINLRSDGEKVLLAYKLERSTPTRGWDYYLLEPDADGQLVYRSKYD